MSKIDTVTVKQILSRQQGEGQVLLDTIADIDARIQVYRKEGQVFVYEIVRALILLTKHGGEPTIEAAKDCLAKHFLPEVRRIHTAFEAELKNRRK